MLSPDQADFFNSMMDPHGSWDSDGLYLSALDMIPGTELLLYKAVDILDACADSNFQSNIRCVQLQGDKSHCYWIVTTDVETNDKRQVRQASIEEHMCLPTGCSCTSFTNLSRALSGREIMCEHMLAIRLATCKGLIHDRLNLDSDKFSESMHKDTGNYFKTAAAQV